MPRILITYDLRKSRRTEEEYSDLYTALESMGAKRIQESVWVARTDRTAPAILRKLQGCIGKNDRLWVVKFTEFISRKGINRIGPI